MKSIEKAKELLEEHKCNITYYGQSWQEIEKDAIIHAIITVDEVLKIIRYHGTDIGEHSLMFWNEVRTELEKLK